MSKKYNKPYEEYVKLFKKLCKKLGRTLTGRDLRSKNINLPSDIWFIKNCPNEDVKTYNDFLSWLGYKANKIHRKYTFEIAFEEFAKRGFKLLPQEYKSCSVKMKYICKKHPEFVQEMSLNALIFGEKGCRYCHIDYYVGSNTGAWKGGTSPINAYLREFIDEWKKSSMKSCNYKCVISGENFSEIHHLYSYNKILKEVMVELNIDSFKDLNSYSTDEIENIKNTFIKIHGKYPLGVCLSKIIHKLYHHVYGDDNTQEQFEEFKARYNNGEFVELEKEIKSLKSKEPNKISKRNGKSKRNITSEQQINEIREKYATGEYTQKQLAKEYSVKYTTISSIVNRVHAYKD